MFMFMFMFMVFLLSNVCKHSLNSKVRKSQESGKKWLCVVAILSCRPEAGSSACRDLALLGSVDHQADRHTGTTIKSALWITSPVT